MFVRKTHVKPLKLLRDHYHVVNIIHSPDSQPQEESSVGHMPVGQLVDTRAQQCALQRVSPPAVKELGDAEMSTQRRLVGE